VLATHAPLANSIIVTFDGPLAAGSTVDPAAWSGVISNKEWVVSGGSVEGNVVTVLGSLGEIVVASDQVSYRVPPGVLLGGSGLPVVEFVAFPVTAP
jgi:hypothetical protein